ncbi:MAG TPA: exopolysaccharide biosynthesis protein [bacterium]|jgi:hypothetical protein
MSEVLPLSAILADALRTDTAITVGELADRVERRGFGLLMIVLALPTLIPILPPGVAVIVGILYMLLGVQMLWGLEQPWLPQRVRRFQLSAPRVRRLRDQGVGLLQRLERLSRPRPLPLDERIIVRAIALVMVVLGAVLILPFPFLNTLPAMSVLVLGIGLLNRDALFILAGIVLAGTVVIIIVFGAGTLFALYEWLRSRFLQ